MTQENAIVRSGVDLIDARSGEVLTPRTDMVAYLSRLGNNGALTEQKQLAAAYDSACLQLIGENDVQVEGNRTFKKKSAWRKLARYFGISTSVVNVDKGYQDGYGGDNMPIFLATVTVRATAPWGQYAEAAGACGTDEESGRRKITIADAIATAETRATNRAVSNLVAMGEVSAEEMSKGTNGAPPIQSKPPAKQFPPAPEGTPAFRTFVMPFGKSKGVKQLREMTDEDLSGAVEWAADKGKFEEFQAAAERELEYRANFAEAPV